jgi:hypothetical protein
VAVVAATVTATAPVSRASRVATRRPKAKRAMPWQPKAAICRRWPLPPCPWPLRPATGPTS